MSSVSASRDSVAAAAAAPRLVQTEYSSSMSSPTKPLPLPKAATAAASTTDAPSVRYTCFIRLPFPRADFVDPQQVEWSSAKDRLLWKTISKASNSRELDWEELSTRFDVSLPFLLQQAAWLYERHFAQMKAQMKKLSPSAAPSPIPPDSVSNSSTPVTGTFAANSFGPRTTSALSTRARDSPPPTAGSGNSGTMRPAASSIVVATDAPFPTYTTTGPSRTPSIRTVTQSRAGAPGSPVPQSNRSFRSSFGSQRKITAQAPPEDVAEYDSPPPAEPSDPESSSDEDDKPSQSMARSQAFRRPTHFGATRKPGLPSYTDDGDADDDDEDDEDSGGFLPFAAAGTGKHEDVAATLRSPPPKRAPERLAVESSATSSESSAAAPTRRQKPSAQTEPASALSPRQRAGLSALSPRLRREREGSEGTPSMGSSFSDLDDASISQSALEDAYLSNMQRGGTASRMSTISQALKSRYL